MVSGAGLIVGFNCIFPFLLLSFLLMAVHKPVARADIYFITLICYKWLHLIGKTNAYDVVYRFFSHLNEKGHQVAALSLCQTMCTYCCSLVMMPGL
jgi:hypothetical protein